MHAPAHSLDLQLQHHQHQSTFVTSAIQSFYRRTRSSLTSDITTLRNFDFHSLVNRLVPDSLGTSTDYGLASGRGVRLQRVLWGLFIEGYPVTISIIHLLLPYFQDFIGMFASFWSDRRRPPCFVEIKNVIMKS